MAEEHWLIDAPADTAFVGFIRSFTSRLAAGLCSVSPDAGINAAYAAAAFQLIIGVALLVVNRQCSTAEGTAGKGQYRTDADSSRYMHALHLSTFNLAQEFRF